MKRSYDVVLNITLAALSIPAVFYFSAWVFHLMVEEEYRTGVRVSTNGDSVSIPAAGIALAWTLILALAGVVWFARALIHARRRRVG